MKRDLNKMPYTGLDELTNILSHAKSFGNQPHNPENIKYFNLHGYADVNLPLNRTLCAIDLDLLDRPTLYVVSNNKLRMVKDKEINRFKDELVAIAKSPYYHGTEVYVSEIKSLIEGFDPTSFVDVTTFEYRVGAVAEKVLSLRRVVESGTKTFGCAERYNKVINDVNLLVRGFIQNLPTAHSKYTGSLSVPQLTGATMGIQVLCDDTLLAIPTLEGLFVAELIQTIFITGSYVTELRLTRAIRTVVLCLRLYGLISDEELDEFNKGLRKVEEGGTKEYLNNWIRNQPNLIGAK